MRSSSLQRRLDRLVGVPLIAMGASVRRRRPLPASARYVAILQPTAIGDTLISSGIPAAVARRYPAAEIHMMHGPTNRAAVAMVDAALTTQAVDFKDPGRVIAQLRRLRPDVVVDLTPWPRVTALCAMASGAVTVGYDSDGQGRGAAFDLPVVHSGAVHEFENARAMAAVFDDAFAYRAAIKAPGAMQAVDLPYERLALFHTTCGGSRRLDRVWPAARWAELAARLGGAGYVIGFTGAAAEIDEIEPVQRLAAERAETLLLAGRLDLGQFAYAVTAACGLVSLDTGAVHIASGLEAPVVGLYGPALSRRWGPWGFRGRGVDSPHPEAGYSLFGFETSAHCQAIMAAITVDAVHDAFRSVARPPGPRPAAG